MSWENKDSDPEIADKIVFNGSFDRYCILPVPYKENIWDNKDYLTLTLLAAKSIISLKYRLRIDVNDSIGKNKYA